MKPEPEQQDPRLEPREFTVRDVTGTEGGGLIFIPAPREPEDDE